jgi:hypothetical protein
MILSYAKRKELVLTISRRLSEDGASVADIAEDPIFDGLLLAPKDPERFKELRDDFLFEVSNLIDEVDSYVDTDAVEQAAYRLSGAATALLGIDE